MVKMKQKELREMLSITISKNKFEIPHNISHIAINHKMRMRTKIEVGMNTSKKRVVRIQKKLILMSSQKYDKIAKVLHE